MAIRDKIATNAQPYLEPGERIQVVFVGQTKSGWWGLLSYLVFFWNKYLDVIVTDRRILVLQCGAMQSTRPKSLLLVAPRQILIGPANGLWWKCTTLGKQMYVHKRFHKDVTEADSYLNRGGGIAPTAAPPPPPNAFGSPPFPTPNSGAQHQSLPAPDGLPPLPPS